MKLCGVLVLAAVLGCPAFADTNALSVWNIDTGILNDLGGGYNQFAADGSDASVHLVSDVRRGPGGRSMKIVFRKAEAGYCGMWMHLFDEDAVPAKRRLLDASAFPFLSFWVRGAAGGEDFTIQAADESWLAKEDSKPVGPVSKYLGGTITTNWQEVVVPVADFWLDGTMLGGLTFNFTNPGAGAVYVDDITFKLSSDAAVPFSKTEAAPPSAARALARAMWVWEIEPLLSAPAQRDELFAFCREQGVNELFLQLPYAFKNDLSAKVECVIQHPDELRALLGAATAQGIRVHALDGYPEFVLRTQHARVLALVHAILGFNSDGTPEQGFAGIHLDNEPYQLLGFDGPAREDILVQFLELNAMIKNVLREWMSDMKFGVDIPFWFDEAGPSGEPQGMVRFHGVRKDAAKHLLDIVDNVGIMAYRRFAGGVDGIAYHSLPELRYADRTGKKVYIGVETFRYKPTPVRFISGPRETAWSAAKAAGRGNQLASILDGFKVRTLTDGERRYIGLAQSAPTADRRRVQRRAGPVVPRVRRHQRAGGPRVGDPRKPRLHRVRAARAEGFRWPRPRGRLRHDRGHGRQDHVRRHDPRGDGERPRGSGGLLC